MPQIRGSFRSFMFRLPLVALCSLAFLSASAEQCTLYWPHDLTTPLPTWIGAPTLDADATYATMHVPVSRFAAGPDVEHADLAVTVFFVEPPDGFLRAYWVTSEDEIMLSPNLFEGVASAHQRTLLIPAAYLSQQGVLTLQSSSDATPVYAVQLEWLLPTTVSASAGSTLALELATGQSLAHRDLGGVAYLPLAEGWSEDVVTVALSERIETLASGTEYVVAVSAQPSQVRVSMQLAGADLSQPLLVWVNGKYAGFMSIDVPVLADHGYYEDEQGTNRYAGWRRASVHVAGDRFVEGDNSVQFGYAQELPIKLSAKDMMMQLRYPEGTGAARLEDGSLALGPAPDFMSLESTAARPSFR